MSDSANNSSKNEDVSRSRGARVSRVPPKEAADAVAVFQVEHPDGHVEDLEPVYLKLS